MSDSGGEQQLQPEKRPVETQETRQAFKHAWLALENKEEKDLERAEDEWSAAAAKVAPELLRAAELPATVDEAEGVVVEQVVVYEKGYEPTDQSSENTRGTTESEETRLPQLEEQQELPAKEGKKTQEQQENNGRTDMREKESDRGSDTKDTEKEKEEARKETRQQGRTANEESRGPGERMPSAVVQGRLDERREHSFTRFVVRSSSMDMVDEPEYRGAHVGSTVTMETVHDLIEAARRSIPLHRKYVSRILLQTKKYLQHASKVVMDVAVPRDGRLIVVGDTHGQFIDVLTIFDRYGLPSEKNVYVFNGDYVDRGPHGVEIVLVLYAILLANPRAIYLNRGNHEQRHMNERYSFMEEVLAHYSLIEFELFVATFRYLPLVTIIDDRVPVLHGGIPPYPDFDIRAMTDLAFIDPNESREDYAETFDYVLWSDPGPRNGCYPNRRGAGVEWGPDHTENFLRANGFSLLIRSHEVKDEGYEYAHGGRVLTVFSASVYCGANDNKGAVAIYDARAGVLPPDRPRVETYYAIAPSNTSDVCRQKTVDIIRRDFFLLRHRFIAAFEQEDAAGEGLVTVAQFVRVMQRVVDCPLRWDVLWPYFAATDASGLINYSEWLAEYRMTLNDSFLAEWIEDVAVQVCKKMIRQHGDLQRSFADMDADGSNDISYQEFSTALRAYDLGLSDENIFDLFQSLDTSQNGRIEFDEFADRFARLFHKLRYATVPHEWCAKQVLRAHALFLARYGSVEDAFLAIDETQAGRIAGPLFRQVMAQEFGVAYTPEQVDALVCHINCAIDLLASNMFSYAGFNQAVENATAEQYQEQVEHQGDDVVAAAGDNHGDGDDNAHKEGTDSSNNDAGSSIGSRFYSSLLSSIARAFQLHSVQLRRFFRRMDVDFNNQLSIHEFRVGMRVMNELLDTPLTDSQIEKLYHVIDLNGDGGISYEEFMHAFTPSNW